MASPLSASVFTIPRDESLRLGESTISVFSWNVLAHRHFLGQISRGNPSYSFVQEDMLDWTKRCALLVAEMKSSGADVICLQECEHDAFDSDFAPALAALGYQGRAQGEKGGDKRKRDSSHPIGVATFWAADRWRLVGDCHRSRTMATVLERIVPDRKYQVPGNEDDDDNAPRLPAEGLALGVGGLCLDRDCGDESSPLSSSSGSSGSSSSSSSSSSHSSSDGSGSVVAVVNCHLEGAPLKSAQRVTQLSTTLQELQAKHSHQGLVVCGDFNSPLGASASSAFLSFGSVPEGVFEWGHPAPQDVCEVKPHGYADAKLQSALEYPAPTPTTSPTSTPTTSSSEAAASFYSTGKHYTFCTRPGHTVDGLDQIWYSSSSLEVVAVRALFRSSEERVHMATVTGCPCAENPSDHVPVAAVFKWRDLDHLAPNPTPKLSRPAPFAPAPAPVGTPVGAARDGMSAGGAGEAGPTTVAEHSGRRHPDFKQAPKDHRGGGGTGVGSGGGGATDEGSSSRATTTTTNIVGGEDNDLAAAERARQDADSLLWACPLTEEERGEFLAATTKAAALTRATATATTATATTATTLYKVGGTAFTTSGATPPAPPLIATATTSAATTAAATTLETVGDGHGGRSGKRGKPSAEEIAFLQEQQKRREALLRRVTPEARQMLEAVLKLRRQADKHELAHVKLRKKLQLQRQQQGQPKKQGQQQSEGHATEKPDTN